MKSATDATPTSRRHFLSVCAATTLAGVASASRMHAFAQSPQPAHGSSSPASDLGLEANPTPDARLKFNPDGSVKPFAGNTVICHIPQQGDFRDGTVALHDALVGQPFARKLAILPPESYHMTLYPGANDQARERSSWPGGVPRDASIETCNHTMKKRMDAVWLADSFPLRVRLNVESTLRYGRASTLRMEGADPGSERILRSLRDQLAEVYQYRGSDHETYRFHITIAYTMADLTPREMSAYRALLQQKISGIVAATPVLELGLPEFCTFKDMYRFNPEVVLRA